MSNNLKPILSPEDRDKTIQEIERITQEISNTEWELAGEPEDDNDIEEQYEEYLNQPVRQLEQLYDEKEKLEEQLFKDDYYKHLQSFSETQRNSQQLYGLGNILNDNTPVKDLLNRKNKASQLANYICTDSANNSNNIGIIGEWGSGKSTFLDFIKKELVQNNKNDKNISILSYDASSYSEQSQIWANFGKLLFESFEHEKFFPHVRYTLAKIACNKKSFLGNLLLNLLIVFITFLLILGSAFSFSFDALIGKFIGYGFSISGGLLLITQLIIPWTKKSLSASIPLSQKIVSKIKLPSYAETLGTRERIASELDILFNAWLPKKEQKIVIFVDELDRCSNKGISEFFQSIQLLSSMKKIIFVFAIEPSHLKKALMSTYGIEKEAIDSFSMQYLDKYISIIVPLENSISYSNLTSELIKEVNANDQLCIADDEIVTIKKCIGIIPHNYMTPRKIKKIINLLALTKNYSMNYYTQIPLNYCELFSWIILNSFFREAANFTTMLYTNKREYTPLKNVFTTSSKNELIKKLNMVPYIPLIENLNMHDIIIYNKIANDFSIFFY